MTLTELLATVVLIGLVGTMIVGIIPAIRNVLEKITVKARAEMLLNNTVIVLRDQLRYAQDASCSGTSCTFIGNDDWRYELSVDGTKWITLTPLTDETTALGISSESQVQNWHILTNEAASGQLIPTYTGITYNNATGVFTIEGLKVVSNTDSTVKASYQGTDGAAKSLVIRSLN